MGPELRVELSADFGVEIRNSGDIACRAGNQLFFSFVFIRPT
jgi:hypothetical protein